MQICHGKSRTFCAKEQEKVDNVPYQWIQTRELVRKELVIYYPQERSGFVEDKGLGLVHLCFGQGVGKTTRAVGLAVRAAGAGLQVDFVQFLKSGQSGEVKIFEKIPQIHYWCPGEHPFILSSGPRTIHYEHATKSLQYAQEAAQKGTHLLVCDEILDTVLFGLLHKKQLLDLVAVCEGKTELVMTGRNAFPELIEAADYVTEFVQNKHPYYAGARARKGIEY
jgi:cob(I)alamin adenosyltransferase